MERKNIYWESGKRKGVGVKKEKCMSAYVVKWHRHDTGRCVKTPSTEQKVRGYDHRAPAVVCFFVSVWPLAGWLEK